MDISQIREYLRRLEKTRRRLKREELETLYALSIAPDPEVRGDVASLLMDHYEEKSEEVLLRLTYDNEPLVRSNAVDSLRIGRREHTAERLLILAATDSNCGVRGYAVHSLYDVFINTRGDSDATLSRLSALLKPLQLRESDPWVLICYYCILYLCGEQECLKLLLDSLEDSSEHIRSSAVEAFWDILNEDNQAVIEAALQDCLAFESSPELTDRMEELLMAIDEERSSY